MKRKNIEDIHNGRKESRNRWSRWDEQVVKLMLQAAKDVAVSSYPLERCHSTGTFLCCTQSSPTRIEMLPNNYNF